MANSNNFDLSGWKITLPVDKNNGTSGKAIEVKDLEGYNNPTSFYQAKDGAMVFRVETDGATTSGSTYTRSELREMENGRITDWDLGEGGTMTATLKIDEMPYYKNGDFGRIIVGQIHGQDDELVRIYYEDETIYFANEHAKRKGEELEIDVKDKNGNTPDVDLGEVFSYSIVAKGDDLQIKVFADGKEYVSNTEIIKFWQSDDFYFKAGLYSGVNEKNGYGDAQVSFYGLDVGHEKGEGLDGWRVNPGEAQQSKPKANVVKAEDYVPVKAKVEAGAPVAAEKPKAIPSKDIFNKTDADVNGNSDSFDENDITFNGKKLYGDSGANEISGTKKDDIVKGRGGEDKLLGNEGDDYIEGNDGDDIVIGGAGMDTLKGSNDSDVFAYYDTAHGNDVILDFNIEEDDRIDVRNILDEAAGFTKKAAFSDGYIQLEQDGRHLKIYIDMDGYDGAGEREKLATLLKVKASYINESSFLLPDDYSAQVTVNDAFRAELDNIINATRDDTAKFIRGSNDSERLVGGSKNDSLKGIGGNDTLLGGDGEDYLEGNAGRDVLIGGRGADIIKGSDGQDAYIYNELADGGDIIVDFRAEENETLEFSQIFAGNGRSASALLKDNYIITKQSKDGVDVYVDVDGARGQDATFMVTLKDVNIRDLEVDNFIVRNAAVFVGTIDTDVSVAEKFYGNDGNNTLKGSSKNDLIKARDGDDVIYGGKGIDIIQGNDGDDTLIGGEGADILKGGDGNDVFVYENVSDIGDAIIDYRVGDVVDISNITDAYFLTGNTQTGRLLDKGFIDFTKDSDTTISIYLDKDGDYGNHQNELLARLDVFEDTETTDVTLIV